MTDYTPALVTFFMLSLIIFEVVVAAKKGIWLKFEIGVIIASILALGWYAFVKIKGFA